MVLGTKPTSGGAVKAIAGAAAGMVPSFPAIHPPDSRGGRLAEDLKLRVSGGPLVAVEVTATDFARLEGISVLTRATAR